MGPIGCPKTSVLTSLRCVITQKTEEFRPWLPIYVIVIHSIMSFTLVLQLRLQSLHHLIIRPPSLLMFASHSWKSSKKKFLRHFVVHHLYCVPKSTEYPRTKIKPCSPSTRHEDFSRTKGMLPSFILCARCGEWSTSRPVRFNQFS